VTVTAGRPQQTVHAGPLRDFLANVNSRSRSRYAVARPSSVCLSVTLVHPTQAVEIFRNFSTAFDILDTL